MMIPQSVLDKTAISLSVLCALQCLTFPIFATAIPAIGLLDEQAEAFHKGLLVFAIPLAVLALVLGCQKHKNSRVAVLGAAGLLLMVAALFIPSSWVAINTEKTLTLIGAGFIAFSHWKNYRLCREIDCACGAHPPYA